MGVYLLERFPFKVVGHVERISLVLFFVGKEKSLRGQQLISMVHIQMHTHEGENSVREVDVIFDDFATNDWMVKISLR